MKPWVRAVTATLLTITGSPVLSQTVDFDAPGYVTGQSIVGVDGWFLYNTHNPFLVGSDAANKVMRAATADMGYAYRAFPAQSGMFDLTWRWRVLGDSMDFCVQASSTAANVATSFRSMACLETGGNISGQGESRVLSLGKWARGTWYYMRMRLDIPSGKFTLYQSSDSLRTDEKLILSPQNLQGAATATQVSRVVLRTDKAGSPIELDDIVWEPVARWLGNPLDSTWHNPANWSPVGMGVPTASTRVEFTDKALTGCFLNAPAAVRTIYVAEGFKASFDIDTSTLKISGNAVFDGASAYRSTRGTLEFISPKSQSLLPSPSIRPLPEVFHKGTGTLRLDGRFLYARGFSQNAGTFDFTTQDLIIEGAFKVTNGGPASFANLGLRNITVTKQARLEGAGPNSLLGLSTIGKTWRISVSDSLIARYAEIGGSVAGGTQGIAYWSIKGPGQNTNWVFIDPPLITQQPKGDTLVVGDMAAFKVAVASTQAYTLQWFVGGRAVPGAKDSVFTIPAVRKAHNDSLVTVEVTNGAGKVESSPARLVVTFPAPDASPGSQGFTDSIRVTVTSKVQGATLAASLNGGAWFTTGGSFTFRDSTWLRARSVLNGDSGDINAWTYTRSPTHKTEPPEIEPLRADFTDSLHVTLIPVTASSRIHYTDDGSQPDTTRNLYQGRPLVIRATTTIKAIAVADGLLPSDVRFRTYVRKSIGDSIPPPEATPPGDVFTDSVIVKLATPQTPEATIFYSLDYGRGWSPWVPYDSVAGIHLRETAKVRAQAVLGASAFSDTASWTFMRSAPAATPKGIVFKDSLFVGLRLTGKSGGFIHYTTDGSQPDSASKRYSGPIRLDSTAVIKAISHKPGWLPSAVLAETYRLVPEVTASPRSGEFFTALAIELKSTSPKARIRYTLDSTDPGPGEGTLYTGPIALSTNATLKAVAVLGEGPGSAAGPILKETYAFYEGGKATLAAGLQLKLTDNYSLTNKGTSDVVVEVLLHDSLRTLRGFRDVQFGVRISLAEGAPAFPSLSFNQPKGEERMLYQLHPGGLVDYVTDADTAKLPEPGAYFLGIDTLPPKIAVSNEIITAGDSTTTVFSIKDNVANLLLDLERSDDPGRNIARQRIANQEILTVVMKARPDTIHPLTLRLRVDDRRNVARFPPESTAAYDVAQVHGKVRSPVHFRIGWSTDFPWDLVSFPLAMEKKLTLARLRADNSAQDLRGMRWDIGKNPPEYSLLADDEPIEPGASIWLGMQGSLASLAFQEVKTVPLRGATTFKVKLHKGWNQIANPTLSPLYWPYSINIPAALDGSPVKSLRAYNGGGGYYHTDTLKPWKGYFVNNRGDGEVEVTLLASPVKPPTAKAAAGEGPSLRMSLGSWQQLRLGGRAWARDGAGLEDEPQPPAHEGLAPALWSARENHRLGTDILRWKPGSLLRWRIVAGLPVVVRSAPREDGSIEATPRSARVDGLELPEGYAAWAVSASRGLKLRLGEGGEIPLFPGFTDSLEVFAGPAAELDARLASVPEAVGEQLITAAVTPARGAVLRLRLPQARRVAWSLWTPAGRRVAEGILSLPPGIYERPLGEGKIRGAGIYLLRAAWSPDKSAQGSPKGAGRLTATLAIP